LPRGTILSGVLSGLCAVLCCRRVLSDLSTVCHHASVVSHLLADTQLVTQYLLTLLAEYQVGRNTRSSVWACVLVCTCVLCQLGRIAKPPPPRGGGEGRDCLTHLVPQHQLTLLAQSQVGCNKSRLSDWACGLDGLCACALCGLSVGLTGQGTPPPARGGGGVGGGGGGSATPGAVGQTPPGAAAVKLLGDQWQHHLQLAQSAAAARACAASLLLLHGSVQARRLEHTLRRSLYMPSGPTTPVQLYVVPELTTIACMC
jgi:hypothetical protein